MAKRHFVVTDPEAGWDCVKGIYLANNEQEIKDYLKQEDCEGDEDEEEYWDDDRYVVHKIYNIKEV